MTNPTWKCILHDHLVQRSSHTLSILDHKAYLFGGELLPRKPKDNDMFTLDLDSPGCPIMKTSTANPPSARVGSTSTTLASKLYIFSGRGGPSMSPSEDPPGSLWCFYPNPKTSANQWSLLKPTDLQADYPSARSYHCMTNDGTNTLYLHAGCPATGRLSDLWSFNILSQTWTQLASAPGPQRGGSSITYHANKLYRMNGFDGNTEQGGSLDIYDMQANEWTQKDFIADGVHGPEARSVASLLTARVSGRPTLITLFGERDPSALGHAGAGKMLGDVWLYDIEKEEWRKLEAEGESPPARGWFDADVLGESKVVIAGGLNEENERLDDVWVLSL